MHRRILTFAMALSLSPFAAQTLWAAPVSASPRTASDRPIKVKSTRFNMRNDSAAALTIKAGEQEFTIEPGKTTALKLENGVQVTAVNGTPHISAGSVIVTVNSTLDGNTLAVS